MLRALLSGEGHHQALNFLVDVRQLPRRLPLLLHSFLHSRTPGKKFLQLSRHPSLQLPEIHPDGTAAHLQIGPPAADEVILVPIPG